MVSSTDRKNYDISKLRPPLKNTGFLQSTILSIHLEVCQVFHISIIAVIVLQTNYILHAVSRHKVIQPKDVCLVITAPFPTEPARKKKDKPKEYPNSNDMMGGFLKPEDIKVVLWPHPRNSDLFHGYYLSSSGVLYLQFGKNHRKSMKIMGIQGYHPKK